MRLQYKLFAGCLIILVTLAIVSYFSYGASRSTLRGYQELSHQTLPVIMALDEIRISTHRIVHNSNEYALNIAIGRDSPGQMDTLTRKLQTIMQNERELDQALLSYIDLVKRFFPDEQRIAMNLAVEAEQLKNLSRRFISALQNSTAQAAQFEIKNALELSERRFIEAINRAISHEQNEIQERSESVQQHMDHHRSLIIVSMLSITAISLLLTLLAYRHISMPISALTRATAKLAKGDFLQRLPSSSADEIGELTRSFNNMSVELQAMHNRIEASARYTENILRVMIDMLITTDPDGNIHKVNQAVCEILGYTEELLRGMPITALFDQAMTIEDFIAMADNTQREQTLLHADGHEVSVQMTLNPIEDEQLQLSGYLCVAYNISDRKQAEEKIHRLAFYDPLSGLPNRSLFNDRLQQSLKIAQRQNHMVAVMFMDLDNFKKVNDSMGHEAGDQLLREVAGRLTDSLRDSDVVAQRGHHLIVPTISRHGGDEFMILLPYVGSGTDAAKVAERIEESLRHSIQIQQHDVTVSASIGIALYPNDGANSAELLQNADTALYSAKSKGRNTYQFFKPEMNAATLRHLDIENHLRSALANNELELLYQPQFDIFQGHIVGVEALLRWRHPELGAVSPVEFIPVAEASGLILPIGDWVLHEACKQWRRWQLAGCGPIKVGVNLSAVQFRDESLASKVSSIMRETGIPPSALVLEITESVVMGDVETTKANIDRLKKLGLRFSMDDFGTGYSSLSYLKTFNLDYLKIDRSFINDLDQSTSEIEIVKTIIAMGQNLQMTLIAEGVESPEQLTLLQQMGCHQIQGYLLSRPVEHDIIERLLLDAEQQSDSGLALCRTVLGFDSKRATEH